MFNVIKPEYAQCSECGMWHRVDWRGDCREVEESYTPQHLNLLHGEDGWEDVEEEAV